MIPIDHIKLAADMIKGDIIRTPMVYSPTFSRMFGAKVYLKLENLQKTGSFKIRGAAYKLRKHRKRIGKAGVVAASAGNHAQGVSLAAGQLGIKTVIVMPEWASLSKQEATARYGSRVIIHGQSIEDSLQKTNDFVKKGSMLVHPFDDPDVIAGQGTIGLEILEDLPDVDLVLAPVGGGGLISGIASAIKTVKPDTRIIGVQAEACPSAVQSLSNGKPVQIESEPSIADGIHVRQTGAVPFKIIQKNVERVVAVDEEQIASSILMLLERKKILAEGAGAVCLAALLGGKIAIPPDSRVVLVISGGNLDSPLLGRIISQGLAKHGRIMTCQVLLEDRPGSLARLLSAVAGLNANVLRIHHSRNRSGLPIGVAIVDLELETRNAAHIHEIKKKLDLLGYETTFSDQVTRKGTEGLS